MLASTADIVNAVWTCVGAIGACIFGYYQYKINIRLLENSCISEVECILATVRQFDDDEPSYKLFFRARGNSPVSILFAFLWKQYFQLNYTLLWEDIIYSFELLWIGDDPNIELYYKDNIGRYYKKSFVLELKEWQQEKLLHGSFKEQITRKDIKKILKQEISNTHLSSSNK